MSNDFYQTGFGWITPNGELIGGEPYSHINLLRYDPNIPAKLRALFDEAEDASKRCSDLQESGEHPEWHIYEDAIFDVIYGVYKHGYIRLGVNTLGGVFEAEGISEIILSRMDLINRIKERFEQENDIELTTKVQRR
jgi:hypothetical protein